MDWQSILLRILKVILLSFSTMMLSVVFWGLMMVLLILLSPSKKEAEEPVKEMIQEQKAEFKPQIALINQHNVSFSKKIKGDFDEKSDWWPDLRIGEEVLVLAKENWYDPSRIYPPPERYYKVQRMSRAKEVGYINDALATIGGQMAVVRNSAHVYNIYDVYNSDFFDPRDNFEHHMRVSLWLSPGTMTVVSPETRLDNGWIQLDSSPSYVKESSLSYEESDIQAAKWLLLAGEVETRLQKMELLRKAQALKSEIFKRNIADFIDILNGELPRSVLKETLKAVDDASEIDLSGWVFYNLYPNGYSPTTAQTHSLAWHRSLEVMYATDARIQEGGEYGNWFFVKNMGWVFKSDHDEWARLRFSNDPDWVQDDDGDWIRRSTLESRNRHMEMNIQAE